MGGTTCKNRHAISCTSPDFTRKVRGQADPARKQARAKAEALRDRAPQRDLAWRNANDLDCSASAWSDEHRVSAENGRGDADSRKRLHAPHQTFVEPTSRTRAQLHPSRADNAVQGGTCRPGNALAGYQNTEHQRNTDGDPYSSERLLHAVPSKAPSIHSQKWAETNPRNRGAISSGASSPRQNTCAIAALPPVRRAGTHVGGPRPRLVASPLTRRPSRR